MTAPVDKMTRDELLYAFSQKAGCYHSRYQATSLWLRLRERLSVEQRNRIADCWIHILDCNEDPKHLHKACKEIAEEYKLENS